MPPWLSRRHALRGARGGSRWVAGLLLILCLAAGTAVVAAWLVPVPETISGPAHVTDGDSLEIAGRRVRLVGLDAPELGQTCWNAKGSEWPCGASARSLLADFAGGRVVACDRVGEDRFGRLLARCSVDGVDLGARVVLAGMAVSDGAYAAQQEAARNGGAGLWSGRFVHPRVWRDENQQGAPEPGPLELVWRWLRELTGATPLR